MRAGHDIDGDICQLVDALKSMDNCVIDIIEIDTQKAHDITWQGSIEAADKNVNMHNTNIREYINSMSTNSCMHVEHLTWVNGS